MKYNFTHEQLMNIYRTHQRSGPREAYREFHNDYSGDVRTLDVEDFAIAFYTQYNSRFGLTF